MNEYFSGPLFIVGMPRSGTKLLRSVLNEHSKISIPNIETKFLPYWQKNWESYGDLSNPKQFKLFYDIMIQLPYFIYLRSKGNIIDWKEWYELCNDFTISGIFEALMRHDTNADDDLGIIWGDKSPSYINHILMLKNLYPKSKFIHIIRDVRDYCLSMNKTWGKNMYRAAQRWSENVYNARITGQKIGMDYMEVKYEDLLDNSELECKKICNFLNKEYESTMLELSTSSENLGDTKGAKTIVKSNKNKYLKLLKPKVLFTIESISYPILESLEYPLENRNLKTKKMGNLAMQYYWFLDGINLMIFRFKEQGFINAIKLQFQLFRISDQRISRKH